MLNSFPYYRNKTDKLIQNLPEPAFYFQSPAKGQVFAAGEIIAIRWVHDAPIPPATVTVELRLGTTGRTISSIVAGLRFQDGYAWTVPTDLGTGYYSIYISGVSGGKTIKGNSANFIIRGKGDLPPSENITIYTPGYGAVWKYGKTASVSWLWSSGTTVFPTQISIYLIPQPADNKNPDMITISGNTLIPVREKAFFYEKTITGRRVNATDYTPDDKVPPGKYVAKVVAYYPIEWDMGMEAGKVGEGYSGVFTVSDSDSGATVSGRKPGFSTLLWITCWFGWVAWELLF